MAWDKATVIEGTPSGRTVDKQAFIRMVRSRYAALLDTQQYRFVGDSSAWQNKHGEKMTAEKEYVVELQTRDGDHQIVSFRLVYDWLVHCHLVAKVHVVSASIGKHFPGADDSSLLDI